MVDPDALRRAFDDYAAALLLPYRIGDVLYRLTDQAVEVLGVDGAGVSVAQDGQDLSFVAATDARVATVEAQQEAGAEGPCHQAYRTGRAVVVCDLADETRWPDYCTTALDQGCRAVAGLPMPTHVRRIGALNLYQHHRHDWTHDELATGQLLANMASGYILNHHELTKTRTVVDQLQEALDSRIIIEQAKGIVAARRCITTSEAFQRLRHQARSTNTRLHDLCQQVVDTAALRSSSR
ncbi:GAF and ANTAR domain-containing protein [Salsipaludibacter albus]|uniref:GAF and ANTAR domain-containing protein n=1 Tax=Salsipaludibacter albus TaxID=2849650 RepID=UPI001EE3A867|nr:GAF and ANTAR domain-containing protein [Salsipaludibacter albus]MBY5161395.1 GAF and ANTAR domain-containing protein [Salsipaludibacter albus]